MKFFRLVFTTIFLIILCFSKLIVTVQAEVDASSEYNINVRVGENGLVTVEYVITLVNRSSEFYVRDYSLVFDYKNINNIVVYEDGKTADYRSESIEDTFRVTVPLSRQLLHNGDSTNLTVQFETSELFIHDGTLWRLSIPPIRTEEALERASFTVILPEAFGTVSYKHYKHKTIEHKDGYNIITYSQKDAPEGLLLTLGDKQQFEFGYTVYVKNDSSVAKKYNLYLPPETTEQQVAFLSAEPTPDNTYVDIQGNVIAEYHLDPRESFDLKINGYTSLIQKPNEAEVSDTSFYLGDTPYWDWTSDVIKKTIETITRDDYTQYENARFLHEYLVSQYVYSSDASERSKASDLLSKKEEDNKISCQSFSDLYSAMLRGTGIPSRQVVGYSPSIGSPTSLHYWTEFYDTQKTRWVPVDTCLEDVYGFSEFDNLDLNRIILAYRGASDSRPDIIDPFTQYQEQYPESLSLKPGAYEFTPWEGDLDLSIKVGKTDMFFRTIPLLVKINNPSPNIVTLQNVAVDEQKINTQFITGNSTLMGAVFPHTEKEFRLNLNDAIDKITDGNHSISLEVRHNDKTQSIDNKFDIHRSLSLPSIAIFLAAGLLTITTVAFFLLVIKRIRIITRKSQSNSYRKSNMGGMLDTPIM